MEQYRIVLDTNILVAGLRSRRGSAFQMLTRIGTKAFDLVLSVPLLLEYETVLARERVGVSPRQAADILEHCQT